MASHSQAVSSSSSSVDGFGVRHERNDAPRRTFYPEIEPYETGMMPVSAGHQLYYEVSGNPSGKPVLFVHGGPGGGTSPKHRRYFDPVKYKIVLMDQRGCGNSTPHASLEENTTWHLVADMEQLREHLHIERWQLFGGSWGSTLALAYAEKHPERVTELVLRGIFLLRRSEILWFYQDGASHIFPDYWESYLAPIPMEERSDLVSAYYRRLTSEDRNVRMEAAKAWAIWEGATSYHNVNEENVARCGGDEFAEAFARIECHYFVHEGWLSNQQLLREVGSIRHIPAVIVQGRYDVVCPIRSAWDLHRAWPEADLVIVDDSGHSGFEPGIVSELIAATDKFASA